MKNICGEIEADILNDTFTISFKDFFDNIVVYSSLITKANVEASKKNELLDIFQRVTSHLYEMTENTPLMQELAYKLSKLQSE